VLDCWSLLLIVRAYSKYCNVYKDSILKHRARTKYSNFVFNYAQGLRTSAKGKFVPYIHSVWHACKLIAVLKASSESVLMQMQFMNRCNWQTRNFLYISYLTTVWTNVKVTRIHRVWYCNYEHDVLCLLLSSTSVVWVTVGILVELFTQSTWGHTTTWGLPVLLGHVLMRLLKLCTSTVLAHAVHAMS